MKNKQNQQYPFVELTNDRVFKKYFSSNNEVLLFMLKAFLPLPDKKKVQSVEIIVDKEIEAKQDKELLKGQKLDTPNFDKKSRVTLTDQPQAQGLTIKDSHLYPHLMGEKQVVLDLNVSLNTGEKVDVEMQVANQQSFSNRVVFYWANLHSTGLKISKGYEHLHPTYSLIFTTFPMFGKEDKRGIVTSCSIRSDKPPYFALNNQLRMVFVELNRFKRGIKQLVDNQDEWCYFIKNAGKMSREEAKLLSKKGEDMAKAVGLLDNVSKGDLALLRRKSWEKYQRDQRAIRAFAFNEGMEQGIKDGVQKGMEKGMQAGIEQGQTKGHAEGTQTVALNMLKLGLELSLICKVTGLSVDEVHKLKDQS